MANKKIRQEINLTNVEADPVDSIEVGYGNCGVAKIESANYNGATAYFEVVAKNSDSSAHPVWLSIINTATRGGNQDESVSISANTTNWTRFRSSSFLLSTYSTDPYYNYVIELAYDNDISVKSAKVIILQDATDITDTQTQIEVGAYEVWADVATAETYYPLAEAKIWKYEASKWDPTPTFKLGFTALNENDMDTTRIALQESSDAAFTSPSTVTNSIVSFTTETITYYESSAFTPTNGYYYRVAYTNDGAKYGGTIYNAKVICTSTHATAISKVQTEYLLINEAQTDTGLQEYQTYYDPAEWDDGGGSKPTFYHEHVGSSASSNTKLQEDPGGTPADITNSDITGDDLTRGGSALTMPSTAKEIDAYIVTA